MSFIKDNGGPIVLGGVAIAIVVGYIELRAPLMVAKQLEAAGVVPKHQITAMEDDIEDLEEEDKKLDNKIERIVGILLED